MRRDSILVDLKSLTDVNKTVWKSTEPVTFSEGRKNPLLWKELTSVTHVTMKTIYHILYYPLFYIYIKVTLCCYEALRKFVLLRKMDAK